MNDMLDLVLLFMLIIIYLAVMALCIASYVMTSYSLYTIAKRRQIKKTWLAWIPVVNAWTWGSIADDYDEQNGFKRKWRIVLIAFSIILILTTVLFYIVMFWGISSVNMYADTMTAEFWSIFITMYAFIILAAIVSVALSVCKSICLFKLYESTVPEKAVKYLLLSLLVPMAEAICLIRCKDKGYSKSTPIEVNFADYEINTQE